MLQSDVVLCSSDECLEEGICYPDGSPSPSNDTLLCDGGVWVPIPEEPSLPPPIKDDTGIEEYDVAGSIDGLTLLSSDDSFPSPVVPEDNGFFLEYDYAGDELTAYVFEHLSSEETQYDSEMLYSGYSDWIISDTPNILFSDNPSFYIFTGSNDYTNAVMWVTEPYTTATGDTAHKVVVLYSDNTLEKSHIADVWTSFISEYKSLAGAEGEIVADGDGEITGNLECSVTSTQATTADDVSLDIDGGVLCTEIKWDDGTVTDCSSFDHTYSYGGIYSPSATIDGNDVSCGTVFVTDSTFSSGVTCTAAETEAGVEFTVVDDGKGASCTLNFDDGSPSEFRSCSYLQNNPVTHDYAYGSFDPYIQVWLGNSGTGGLELKAIIPCGNLLLE